MITYGYVHRDIRRNNLEGQLALMKRCGVEEERIFVTMRAIMSADKVNWKNCWD